MARNPEGEMTARERRYIDNRRMGMDERPALLAAGYKDVQSARVSLKTRPLVQAELAQMYGEARKKANVTRDDVLAGFQEAINDAKLAGDPATQIKGWTEIGKMCGFYAPEERKITVDITQTELLKQIDSMSTEELLELAEQDSLEVIEAEYEVVEDGDDHVQAQISG